MGKKKKRISPLIIGSYSANQHSFEMNKPIASGIRNRATVPSISPKAKIEIIARIKIRTTRIFCLTILLITFSSMNNACVFCLCYEYSTF